MADEQRLNSLDRFRKRPERLVLEQHSHCEVPAGCGGVVLRWRNPLAAVPLVVYLYTPVEAGLYLDGVEPAAARIDVVPGEHVIAIALPEVDLSEGLLMFAAIHESKKDRGVEPEWVTEPDVKIVSTDDGAWKFTLVEPADAAWTALAFDDNDWPALSRARPRQVNPGQFGSHQAYHCRQHGAFFLRVPESVAAEVPVGWWTRWLTSRSTEATTASHGRIWIRKRFAVPAAEIRPPKA
jgi:hypothetical protein